MLDWLIVGGGVHGSHLALVLRERLGVAASDLRVVDDAPAPFAAWRQRAAACGMDFLRSPQAHHVGLRTDALRAFAARDGFGEEAFIPPYRRPSADLFDAHCEALISAHGLDRLRERDRVERIEAHGDGYRVHGRRGAWTARRVLLAPGPQAPGRPYWARSLPHVFDPGFSRPALPRRGPVAVIGGGITAAQLALSLVAGGREVHLVSRSRPRRADFDSAPCYAGPKCLEPFLAGGWRARRRRIAAARNPGTLPRDVAAGLQRALRDGRIRLHHGNAAAVGDAGVQLADRRVVPADAVVLATGFDDRRPGGALVDRLIRDFDLPLAPCGYPAPDPALRWRPGLHVAGRLAELELGPMAGNIRGARMAGERLVRHCRDGDSLVKLDGGDTELETTP